ncbi:MULTISPECIES: hypothetical protein [Hyphobacterium]|uniref:Uncharacterized protein n=1 Tax=Hyphobacterium vulgare TaxID=1736751 RepID=A0ABV6ZWN5_9PROT
MLFFEIASLGSALLGASLAWAAQDGDPACAALDSYLPPPAGTEILYETVNDEGRALSITTLNRIGESDGAETDWIRQSISSFDMAGERLFPPRDQRSVAALFMLESGPSDGDEGQRRYGYSDDPLELLTGLQPGETATTERAETSAMGNRTRTIRGPLIITFEGCGTVDVGGVEEPVRFYRLVSDSRSYMPGRRPEADMTVTTSRTIALSTRYGWPLQTDTGEYLIRATRVSLPDEAGDADVE